MPVVLCLPNLGMRELDPSKQAQKFLRKLPPKQKRQLLGKIEGLLEDPLPHDSKLMRGSRDTYRADQGEYRIVYRFNQSTLFLLIVDRRNDGEAYKKYTRMVQMILLGFVG